MPPPRTISLAVLTLLAPLGAAALPSAAQATGVTYISFEDLPAVCTFSATKPLRGRYAAAKFSGPSATDGGAVLDNCSGFGVAPRTGNRFLAFNDGVGTLANGGTPRGPEKIALPILQKTVTIWVSQAVAPASATFKLTGKRDGKVVTTTLANTTTSDYLELTVHNNKGFDSLVLSAPTEPDGAWVADDLTMSN